MQDWAFNFNALFGFYALVAALYAVVPGSIRIGHVVHPVSKKKLLYRLNGLRVLVLVWIALALASNSGLVRADVLFYGRFHFAAAACALGLLVTVWLALRGNPHADPNAKVDLSLSARINRMYLGYEDNPQWGKFDSRWGYDETARKFDAKMYLYLVGAVVLSLNIFSFAAHQHIACVENPSCTVQPIALPFLPPLRIPSSTLAYVVLFNFFIVEYLFHEHVHLYTYDFVAEKVGFKLAWGCICFYPFFYPVGAWTIANYDGHLHSPLLVWSSVVVFFTGYVLSRGANNQKFLFKVKPKAKFLGLIEPVALGNRVLCSGWWGLSRHINYLGEILMATALALLCDYTSPLPWLYPLYYLGLLIPRQWSDDDICKAKYGAVWDEYCKRVPYRIVPFVY